ncbi:hypothetical protein SUGI_0043820 [Cryptomeria japonica]|nr:hypothetical protein SUGI_0043820 [Cryptomeria japonica]
MTYAAPSGYSHVCSTRSEFKDDLKLYVHPNLKYIGIELRQVKSGTFFDNILVSDDLESAKKLAEEI